MKRIFCLTLAILFFAAATPLNALAASYSVGNGEELYNSWQAANEGEERSNTFELTADVDMSGYELIADADRVYIIASAENAANTIANVTLGAVEPEEGIQADALVLIQTDVTGEEQALVISGKMDVFITGSVIVDHGDGAEATVPAVVVSGESELTVKENVTSDAGGINVINSSAVIEGDVTLEGSGTADCENYVIYAIDDSDVTVGGDVSSDEGGIHAMESEIAVAGDVRTEGQIGVSDHSTVAVGGDLVCNLTGVDTGAAPGVFVYSSQLDVSGRLDTPELYVFDDSKVTVFSTTTADTIYVGGYDEPEDNSQLTTGRIGTVEEDCYIAASGGTYTKIQGNVYGEIWADTEARVDVFGDVTGECVAGDRAVINTNLAYPDDRELHYGEDITDPLAALCLGYTPGSALYEQTLNLHSLLAQVSTDLDNEMTPADRIAASIFQTDDYIIQNLPSLYKVLKSDPYIMKANYQLLLNTPEINAYKVDLYMDNLHESMKKIPFEATETIQDTRKTVLSTLTDLFCRAADGSAVLSAQQEAFLKKFESGDFTLTDANDYLVQSGIYGENDPELMHAAHVMADMSALFQSLATSSVDTDEAKAGLSLLFMVPELLEYVSANYDAPIRVIDSMLAEPTSSITMVYALSQLREEYSDKFIGVMNRVIEKFSEIIVESLNPLKTGVALVDDIPYAEILQELEEADGPVGQLIDELQQDGSPLQGKTNGFLQLLHGLNRGDVLVDACALTEIGPEALETYKKAIRRVQEGDTSPEAMESVRISYQFLISTLDTMCDAMGKVGDKKQQRQYEDIRRQLQSMEIGEDLGSW